MQYMSTHFHVYVLATPERRRVLMSFIKPDKH